MKLYCHLDIENTPAAKFECNTCKKCQPKSKLDYPFGKDLNNSDIFVQVLKFYIESSTLLKCKDPETNKNPDIQVMDVTIDNYLICRVEAKYLKGKAFVNASNIINLKPKETLVIDEPKLLHYFTCKKSDFEKFNREVPIFVVWHFDRPCDDIGGITVFQEIDTLEKIYYKFPNRSFERQSASTDFHCGQKIGITKKFHFSIKETMPIFQLLPAIFSIKKEFSDWATYNLVCSNCGQEYKTKNPKAKICMNCFEKRTIK